MIAQMFYSHPILMLLEATELPHHKEDKGLAQESENSSSHVVPSTVMLSVKVWSASVSQHLACQINDTFNALKLLRDSKD